MININPTIMKKIFLSTLILLITMTFHSCEIDNVTGPDASIEGVILDKNGKPVQFEQGSSSGRIKLEETSWSETPVPLYLNILQDGNYVNKKMFAATYMATLVEGAFYPTTGEEIKVSGNFKHDFHIVPYLDIEWVGEPVVLADKKVSATFKFKRNEGPNGEPKPSLMDYQLFISTNQYVGNNNFDGTRVGQPVRLTDDMENTNITVTSLQPMKYETTFYVRVGARVNDNYKKYNYSTIKTVTVPGN